jgi:mortality factor 4-like protein 1
MSITYHKGEKVLCYHGPQIYEAKVLEVKDWEKPAPQTKVTGWHYRIHYNGWKDT